MRKFKHTKTGDIAKYFSDMMYEIEPEYMIIPAKYIEGSADWEELKPEYPKIISFKSLYPWENGLIVTYEGNRCIKRSDGREPFNIIDFNTALKDPKTIIFEVAKSETEIFTVGDKITFNGLGGSDWENKSTEILRFEYRQNGELAAKYSNGIVAMDKIQKAKEPLFTKEQEKEIISLILRYI
jgi:hypothetical protein